MQAFDWDSSVKMSKVMNMLEVGDEARVITKAGYTIPMKFQAKNPHLMKASYDEIDGSSWDAYYDTADIAILMVKVEGFDPQVADLKSKLDKAYVKGLEEGSRKIMDANDPEADDVPEEAPFEKVEQAIAEDEARAV